MTSAQENGAHTNSAADSEDDELPLAEMMAKVKNEVKNEKEAAPSPAKATPAPASAPVAAPAPSPAANGGEKTAVVPKEEAPSQPPAGGDEDSDDDMPIASLLKSAKSSADDASNGKKRKRPKEEDDGDSKAKEKKEKKPQKDRDDRSERSSRSASAPKPTKAKSRGKDADTHQDVTQRFYSLTKGELVQKLLCRWWYAITWPEPDTLTGAPADYEALEGYPGVFVCVRGDEIGHVLDRRRMHTCPNFSNMCKKPADELKTLLKKALEEQLVQLKAHEGSNRKVEKQIKKELEWTSSVNAKKADQEARKAGYPTAE